MKKELNLYKISQNVNTGYDTYSDAVVCAEDEKEAQHVNPGGFYKWHDGQWYFQYSDGTEDKKGADGDNSWCNPESVKVELIGKAAPKIKKGIICSSFHAG